MNINATKDGTNSVTVYMNGNNGNIVAGGQGEGGSLILRDKTGAALLLIHTGQIDAEEFGAGFGGACLWDGSARTIQLRQKSGTGASGLHLRPTAISIIDTIDLDGGTMKLLMRGGSNKQQTVLLDGNNGNLFLGGNTTDGDIVLHPSGVDNTAPVAMSAIHLSARNSAISVRAGGQESIRIDGKTGDILLMNADGAEEFEIDEEVGLVEPGSVLVIGDETRLRLADRPYDRRVAGIVSGADGLRPGIVLGRSREGRRVPVALFGKVNCKVDATDSPVLAGDLLTTSQTLGYAMRAEPGERASGAVIGKALRGLEAGRGLVPVLVSLH